MAGSKAVIPLAARRALAQLGGDLRIARQKRRIRTALLAERALLSRTTLHKIERGDPSVSMGAYAAVIFVLGMAKRLADLADPAQDMAGLTLENARLPKRVRVRRLKMPGEAGGG